MVQITTSANCELIKFTATEVDIRLRSMRALDLTTKARDADRDQFFDLLGMPAAKGSRKNTMTLFKKALFAAGKPYDLKTGKPGEVLSELDEDGFAKFAWGYVNNSKGRASSLYSTYSNSPLFKFVIFWEHSRIARGVSTAFCFIERDKNGALGFKNNAFGHNPLEANVVDDGAEMVDELGDSASQSVNDLSLKAAFDLSPEGKKIILQQFCDNWDAMMALDFGVPVDEVQKHPSYSLCDDFVAGGSSAKPVTGKGWKGKQAVGTATKKDKK